MATAAARLRSALAPLTTELGTDLAVVWRRVEQAVDAGEILHDILPALISQYGMAAAALGAEWYDGLRDANQVPGRFQAIPAEIPDVGAHQLIGWATATATDFPAFQTLLLGGSQRRIVNFARETVTTSSFRDPKAHGWVRVGVGECEWCRQYLDGEVHYVEGYGFPAHDNCHCTAQPAF